MAYHADFWLIMGTSGPVVLLTHVVTMERITRSALRRAGGQKKLNKEWLEHGLRNRIRSQREQHEEMVAALPKDVQRRHRLARWLRLAPALAAGLGSLLAVTPTLLAFDALKFEKDGAWLGFAQLSLSVSMVLLVVQVLAQQTAGLRGIIE